MHFVDKKVSLNSTEVKKKIITGCWQLSSGHKAFSLEKEDLFRLLSRYIDAGLTVFDCADIYSGVEKLLGELKSRYPFIQIHTKYVPDLDQLSNLSETDVRMAIDRSCQRLQSDALDLVQFCWWDYEKKDYLMPLRVLHTLQTEGKIKHVGLTNLDTRHTQRILDVGIPIQTIQTQYSLIDRRPESSLISLAQHHSLKVFSYGSLAGGFLSSKWLNAQEPSLESLKNRSLVKYKLIIDDGIGWTGFQSLLLDLQNLADTHHVQLHEIVLSYMLQHTAVEAVILGLTPSFQPDILEKISSITFTKQELELFQRKEAYLSGEVYELERMRDSKHGRIMYYNFNSLSL